MSARLALAALFVLVGCGAERPDSDGVPVPGREGAVKTAALDRAERRAFDGAPPVIPHDGFPGNCTACHDERGMNVENLGFAPPSPHAGTRHLGATQRCRQCHVEQATTDLFVASNFQGLAQDLRAGSTAHAEAPPMMPHPLLMRENCQACHTGPAAREEIRTPHPERDRCRQCHLPQITDRTFTRGR